MYGLIPLPFVDWGFRASFSVDNVSTPSNPWCFPPGKGLVLHLFQMLFTL